MVSLCVRFFFKSIVQIYIIFIFSVDVFRVVLCRGVLVFSCCFRVVLESEGGLSCHYVSRNVFLPLLFAVLASSLHLVFVLVSSQLALSLGLGS